MTTSLGTRLGTKLGTGLGSTATRGERYLYALTSLAIGSALATAAGGGEPGVGTGTVICVLVRPRAFAAAQQMFTANKTGTGGYGLYLNNGTNAFDFAPYDSVGGFKLARRYMTSTDLGRITLLVATISGTQVSLWVDRVLAQTTTITSFVAAVSASQVIGSDAAANPSTNTDIITVATFRGSPTSGQILAYFDSARSAGDLPTTMQGATASHKWPASGLLKQLTVPASVPDAVTGAGVDAMTKSGTPTVVAIDQTTTKWGYETSALLTGAQGLTLALYYASQAIPSEGRGASTGYHAYYVFRLDSVSVASSPGTHLMSCYGPGNAGWTIFIQSTNTTLRAGHWSGAATPAFQATTASTLSAADVGKVFVALITLDAAGAVLRFMFKRVEVTPAIAASSGITPAPASAVRFGGPTSSAALNGITTLGGGVGLATATLAEYQALCDAIVAADGDVRPIPGKTTRWWSTTKGKLAGSILTLPEQSGSGDNMLATGGAPTEAAIMNRAFGW